MPAIGIGIGGNTHFPVSDLSTVKVVWEASQFPANRVSVGWAHALAAREF